MHLHGPCLFQIRLLELPKLACICDSTCNVRSNNLLCITQKADFRHIVRYVLALDLNQRHARILRPASVLSVTEVTKPCGSSAAPYLLDARITVVCCCGSAGDRSPFLSLKVLEGDLDLLILVQVVELLRVCVGEEEEVGTVAAGESHGATNRADTIAVCVEHANLLAIYHFKELFDLLVLGRLVVILLRDRGIGLGVDLASLELVRHLEDVCCREISRGSDFGRC